MPQTGGSVRGPGPQRVLLIVGGGIAAYKAPELVRALVAAGAEVRVVTTAAAGAFVTRLSLSSVSGHAVRSDLLDASEEGAIGHIELADWPDLIVVAPATANLMARAALGLADDLASTILLASRARRMFAPAMNTNMWQHPATAGHVATLQARGAEIVGPDHGELACGHVGEGRMLDPAKIVEAAWGAWRRGRAWSDRRVVVSAGPTRTYLDAVRFVSNGSTGAMGFALARAAAERGAQVVLITGPVTLPTPPGVARVDVETASQLLEALDAALRAPTDVLAMTAAVSDLALAADAGMPPGKLDKKALVDALATLRWTQEVDVLATLARRWRAQTFMLGFAAQTLADSELVDEEAALTALGRDKLLRKGCDALFANRVDRTDTGFGAATNAGVLLIDEGQGRVRTIASGPPRDKILLARWLLDHLDEAVATKRAGLATGPGGAAE